MTLTALPVYPSTQARKVFSVTQLTNFHSNLLNALAQVIALPQEKWDTPSTSTFLSSYASDAAQQILEALIWQDDQLIKRDKRLHWHVLVLAEKLAISASGLDLGTLLDLCIAFPSNVHRLRSILSATIDRTPHLPATFGTDVVPAFTSQLSPSQSSGLYGLRKTARCLTSLLRACPPCLVRPFMHNEEFSVALARAYDDGLTAISHSYGGIQINVANRELDQWERLWLDTKVDIIDAFHVMVKTMVHYISSATGTDLTTEADRTFSVMFALLDIMPGPQPRSMVVGTTSPVPFLNRALIADYQHAYDLSKILVSALHGVSREDARVEYLESSLRSLDVEPSGRKFKDPGALGLVLYSSGFTPGAPSKSTPTHKGKGKQTAVEPIPPSVDFDLDLQVTQVLEIFPDHSPTYIRKLLVHPSFPFRGSVERVIEALSEGNAPEEDALGDNISEGIPINVPEIEAPMERRNAFDRDVMDLNRVHVGKKRQEDSLIRDRAEVERMKTEILRRVEEMSEDSDDEFRRSKALDVADLDDDLDEVDPSIVKVLGDGEDSGDEDTDDERGTEPAKPETMLELAYIRDPKLFERDAETRRSKSRADLKRQTGWTDEQIEGWRIMLERNPKKERILQKHEFAGNRAIHTQITGATEEQSDGKQRGGSRGGRGRAGPGGRGRGRGRGIDTNGNGSGERKDEVMRGRAFKEKHKSTGRKRGHDKKMAKSTHPIA